MFLRSPKQLRARPSFYAFLVAGAVLAGVGSDRTARADLPPRSHLTQNSPREALPTILGRDDFNAMVEIAKGYGEAELTKTESGDPVIVGTIDGTAYQLFFLECTDHRACAVMNFYAIWNSEGVSLNAINDWNSAQPFHKAYLTEDGLPTVELNLSTAGDLTGERLADAYDRWTIALAEFEREVLGGSF